MAGCCMVKVLGSQVVVGCCRWKDDSSWLEDLNQLRRPIIDSSKREREREIYIYIYKEYVFQSISTDEKQGSIQ